MKRQLFLLMLAISSFSLSGCGGLFTVVGILGERQPPPSINESFYDSPGLEPLEPVLNSSGFEPIDPLLEEIMPEDPHPPALTEQIAQMNARASYENYILRVNFSFQNADGLPLYWTDQKERMDYTITDSENGSFLMTGTSWLLSDTDTLSTSLYEINAIKIVKTVNIRFDFLPSGQKSISIQKTLNL